MKIFEPYVRDFSWALGAVSGSLSVTLFGHGWYAVAAFAGCTLISGSQVLREALRARRTGR